MSWELELELLTRNQNRRGEKLEVADQVRVPSGGGASAK